MKFYDKEINKKAETIKIIFSILILFMLGFGFGYFTCSFEKQKVIDEKEQKIMDQFIELDSLKETIYMYQIYEK